MRKSEVQVLQGLLLAILADYKQAYPSDAIEVDRDISRLSLAVQTRGSSIFLLDLPALGKHFDQCLEAGVYTRSGLPLSGRRWPGEELPKLFSGILVRVFERGSGQLRSQVDPNVVMFLRQIYQFAKGFNHECSKTRTADAVIEFYETDRRIPEPDLDWSGDVIDLDRARRLTLDDRYPIQGFSGFDANDRNVPGDSDACDPWREFSEVDKIELRDLFKRGFGKHCQFAVDYVSTTFGLFDPFHHMPKHGPGAVSDLGTKESKYSFPSWSDKLEKCFPFADLAFVHYGEWIDSYHQHSDAEAPSKLLIVPKTAKAPRLIASEPTSHQWCQQILLSFLVAGIKRSCLRNSISLDDQEPSRALALQASHDMQFSTIDLSSASDRISTWLVERFFRRNLPLLDALHSVRSRWIINGTRVSHPSIPEGVVSLRKFTTMGSACTFPVQSIIFATLAIATILFEENRRPTVASMRRASRMVRVFGDDIIVPTKHDEAVRRTLSVFGLKVNQTKSFRKSHFREACGMDAWCGFDVTPARLNAVPSTTRPSSIMSGIDASNNFFKKGYWHASAYIESLLPPWVRKNLPVVAYTSGRVGLTSFCGPRLDHLRVTWDEATQQRVVTTIVPKARVGRFPQTGQHDLFQYFTERPNYRLVIGSKGPTVKWEPGRSHVLREYLTLRRVPLRFLADESL